MNAIFNFLRYVKTELQMVRNDLVTPLSGYDLQLLYRLQVKEECVMELRSYHTKLKGGKATHTLKRRRGKYT